MRDHPAIKNESRNQETHRRQKKRRNFANANANREKCGSPHKIDDRESQQGLPRRAMVDCFHGKLLPTIYQVRRLIARACGIAAHSQTVHIVCIARKPECRFCPNRIARERSILLAAAIANYD